MDRILKRARQTRARVWVAAGLCAASLAYLWYRSQHQQQQQLQQQSEQQQHSEQQQQHSERQQEQQYPGGRRIYAPLKPNTGEAPELVITIDAQVLYDGETNTLRSSGVDLINKLAKAGRVHLVLSGCSTAADGNDRLANMVTTRAQPLISAVVKNAVFCESNDSVVHIARHLTPSVHVDCSESRVAALRAHVASVVLFAPCPSPTLVDSNVVTTCDYDTVLAVCIAAGSS